MAPLLLLRQLAAHEQQLLARMRPHVPVQRAQVRELLPAVARHLVQERALAVDDLVVGEREDEALRERVDQPERELVVVVQPVHGLVVEVVERVVHPAHVPLEAEAEPAGVGRPRHARPGGRLLGRHQHARHGAVRRRRSAPAGTRSRRGPRGRRTRSGSTRRPCASSRGRASRRPRRRAGRRRGTRAARTARSRAGSSSPRCARS